MPKENNDPFAGMDQVKSSAVKWGKPGDWIKGTLIDNTRETPNKLSDKKEMQHIFEFMMKGGSFHGIDENKRVIENPTIIEPGTFWSVYAKPGLATQLRNAKIGQIVGMRFKEELAPTVKGHNPTKVIQVFLGEMDPEYKGEQAGEGRPSLEDEG